MAKYFKVIFSKEYIPSPQELKNAQYHREIQFEITMRFNTHIKYI